MKELINETEQPLDPHTRLKDIQLALNTLFDRNISKQEMLEMIQPWVNYINGFNRLKSIDAEVEREELRKIIVKLNNGCKALKNLKEFNMSRFNLRYELSGRLNTQDTVISLLEEQIGFVEETRDRLLQKNNVALNQSRLELSAMVSLWVYAEKKYNLEPNTDGGRGNTNPVLDFARIISGISDDEKLRRFHKKYKKWKEHPETLPG